MHWKEYLLDLIEKIKPTEGRINHRITSNVVNTKSIDSLWIDFKFPNFNYNDPFYGEEEYNGNYNMFFETIYSDDKIKASSIIDLQNKNFDFSSNPIIGCFSNSLDIKITKCLFGEINNGNIGFGMTYYITNSDSYGNLDGIEQEHSKILGEINVDLEILDLTVQTKGKNNSKAIASFVDPRIYDVDEIYETDTINWNENRAFFKVPISKKVLNIIHRK